MYTYIPISPPSCVSLPPSLSHPSRWPQKHQADLPVLCSCFPLAILHLIVYICQCYSLTLSPAYPSPSPCPQVHSLHLRFSSCPASRLIRTIFFRSHIYVLADGICLSLSDLLHCMTDSRSIHLTTNNSISFLFVANIPLYICATSSLSIHLLVDT